MVSVSEHWYLWQKAASTEASENLAGEGSFIVCDPQERLSICYLHQLHQPDNMENEITPRVKAMVYSQLA